MNSKRLVIALFVAAVGLNALAVAVAGWLWWKVRPLLSRQPRAPIRWRRLVAGAAAVGALLFLIGAVAWWRHIAPEYSQPGTRNVVTLGRDGSLGGRLLFPPDNAWNTRIDRVPVDSMSQAYIAAIGPDVPLHADFGTDRLGIRLYGIPYDVVDGGAVRKYRIAFDYASESDDVFYPIADNPPIEDGGDRHLLTVDRQSWTLYELFGTAPDAFHQGWQAGAGVRWNLRSDVSRPNGWTSADAAGLSVLAGLARADEVYDFGVIPHALRFGVRRSQAAHRYPARHDASAMHTLDLPPMGLRFRLKSSIRADTFPPGAAVIVRALQQYGMIVADNGGPLYLGGTADRRWKQRDLRALRGIHASDFDVVAPMPPPRTDTVAWHEAPWAHQP